MTFSKSDRLGMRVKVPPRAKGCPSAVSSLYENSFSVKAAKLWNLLPKSVYTIEDLDSFKVAVGKFLDKMPDTPPTPGYTSQCRNSLLDWRIQLGGLRED